MDLRDEINKQLEELVELANDDVVLAKIRLEHLLDNNTLADDYKKELIAKINSLEPDEFRYRLNMIVNSEELKDIIIDYTNQSYENE